MNNKIVVIEVASMKPDDIANDVEFEYIVPDTPSSINVLYAQLFKEWKNISVSPLTLDGWGYRVVLVTGKKL